MWGFSGADAGKIRIDFGGEFSSFTRSPGGDFARLR
jgi:hypothetical protein